MVSAHAPTSSAAGRSFISTSQVVDTPASDRQGGLRGDRGIAAPQPAGDQHRRVPDHQDDQPDHPPEHDLSDEHGPDGGSDVLRRRGREARRALSPAERATAARQVADRVAALVAAIAPGTAGSYLPTDGELDPAFVVDLLRDAGWAMHLPVIGPQRTMQFAEWHEDTPLRENRYGIEEPAEVGELVPVRSLDLVLVPCVAVDPMGHRLGFGAGYYDRALSDAEDPTMTSSRPRPLLVGVVFDVQVVPRVEPQPWDVALDAVVCESATMLTGARTWPSPR